MTEQNYIPLTDKPVPQLISAQLEKFTPASIHAARLTDFDPQRSIALLAEKDGAQVIGADFGGDKGVVQLFTLREGVLVPDDAYTDYVQGDHGAGYLACLERAAEYAAARDIPVGISWGTPLEGTRPIFHAKAKVFFDEFTASYDGDFASVVPTLKACYNDGPAGLVSGLVEANRQRPTSSVVLSINGGGIGMAAFTNGALYSMEAGHVEAIPELNRYNQSEPCGVYGAQYVCVERFGANKVGIEAQWLARTGEQLRARNIEDRYKEGDEFAGELYDNSALIVAHAIQGVASALAIDLSSSSTAIVGHGGAYKFPHYGERIAQILERHTGRPVRLMMAQDFGSKGGNACLDGAALAALLA